MTTQYPYYDICFLVDGSTVHKDFDNIYLGHDNFLEIQPTVEVKAFFEDKQAVQSFYDWWENNTERGKLPFIVKLDYFGTFAPFGVLQETELVETKRDNSYFVDFTLRIVFDENNINNTPPNAIPNTVYIPENTTDNFIKLEAEDAENDPMTYEVQVTPLFGTLRGEPPSLLYTPDPGYQGTDCFSFIARDYFNESKPAVIEIIINDDIRPDHIVTYELNGPVRVSGNFHYKFTTGDWVRGFGGYLDPPDGKLTIASYDHLINNKDKVVDRCTIINWGSRTDYSYYLKGQSGMEPDGFSIESNAGECKGQIFDLMFYACSVEEFATINIPYAVSTYRMFYASEAKVVSIYVRDPGVAGWVQLWRNAVEMFANSKLEYILDMSSHKVEHFDGMFENCVNLRCIEKVNTVKKITTSKMFNNTPALTSPDTNEQQQIMDGMQYNNDGHCGPSGTEITNVYHIGDQHCFIDDLYGYCVSTGEYTIDVPVSSGTVSYNWVTSNGTITSGQGTDTVTVDLNSQTEVLLNIGCSITDNMGTTYSGNFGFLHTRDTSGVFIELYLPKSYEQIDLEAFVVANAAGHTTVRVFNNQVNCSIKSGNLTGYDVELWNNKEIQGLPKSWQDFNGQPNVGLVITSPMKLVNNGNIRGAGGYGGGGGDAGDNTRTYTKSQEYYDKTLYTPSGGVPTYRTCWQAFCDTGAVRVHMNAKITGSDGNCSKTGPYNSPAVNYPGKLYRGSLRERPDSDTYVYGVRREWQTTETAPGGKGGFGGRGQGYNSNWKYGSEGEHPTDSYWGGTGGRGGDWGQQGSTGRTGGGGGATGTIGYLPAPGIIGTDNLVGSPVYGEVDGAIIGPVNSNP